MCICNDMDKADITVKTAVMKKICKYHKKQGQEFHMCDLLPDGMCFEAFSIAYPSALALLYNADIRIPLCQKEITVLQKEQKNTAGEFTFQCPSSKNKVIFQMERKEKLPYFIKKAKHAAENIFKQFFFPVDKIHVEHDVSMKVIDVEGKCPHGHKKEDEFFFNTNNTKILCPASFNSLYPFIQLFYKDIKIPWSDAENSAYIHCPDHEGIIYKIEKR